jgi:hypothetical protein
MNRLNADLSMISRQVKPRANRETAKGLSLSLLPLLLGFLAPGRHPSIATTGNGRNQQTLDGWC